MTDLSDDISTTIIVITLIIDLGVVIWYMFRPGNQSGTGSIKKTDL